MKIAVCDDDKEYMKRTIVPAVCSAAHRAGVTAETVCFTGGNELISDFENSSGYDIVLLDIDMPGINGKKTAERLRVLSSSFFLVFITSYRTEIFNTIPYRINAFIPKDSTEEYMSGELFRVISEYKSFSPEYRLFDVIDGDKKAVVRLTCDDIFCFCCIRRTVYLKTGNHTYQLVGKKISELEREYRELGFFELCRGYIVNISKVKAMNSLDVELDNGEKLPLSRRKAKELFARISEYVTERAL